MNRCYNCKFWATVDDGYSNWTVTETTVHCLKRHFEPTEESYSWKYGKDPVDDHEFFKQAETCPDFHNDPEGHQIEFDVDGYVTMGDYIEDEILYAAGKEYFPDR